METNIYSTAMSALSHSVSLMEAQKDKDMIRASFHNILGKVDILHICGIISDEEKQFWEDRVYKAYGFEQFYLILEQMKSKKSQENMKK